jgi:hypothetical protein
MIGDGLETAGEARIVDRGDPRMLKHQGFKLTL